MTARFYKSRGLSVNWQYVIICVYDTTNTINKSPHKKGGLFKLQTNYSVQAAMLLAAGFSIKLDDFKLGVKDTEEALKLAAESSLNKLTDLSEALEMGIESE